MKSYLLLSLLCLLQSCGSRIAESASTSALQNNSASGRQVSIDISGTQARILYDAVLNAGGANLHDLHEDGHARLEASTCTRIFYRLTNYHCDLLSKPNGTVVTLDGLAEGAAGQLVEALIRTPIGLIETSLGIEETIKVSSIDCIAFAVTGGYKCSMIQKISDQHVPNRHADVPSFTVYMKLTSVSDTSKVYATTISSSQNGDEGQVVYSAISCFGSDYTTATCQTRTVNISAIEGKPSTMQIVLPSGTSYEASLTCERMKTGMFCSSTSVEM
jgi:hypothetical protein